MKLKLYEILEVFFSFWLCDIAGNVCGFAKLRSSEPFTFR